MIPHSKIGTFCATSLVDSKCNNYAIMFTIISSIVKCKGVWVNMKFIILCVKETVVLKQHATLYRGLRKPLPTLLEGLETICKFFRQPSLRCTTQISHYMIYLNHSSCSNTNYYEPPLNINYSLSQQTTITNKAQNISHNIHT